MPCKTRQAAQWGGHPKPHYYLPSPTTRRFKFDNTWRHTKAAEQALQAFEARIDWSTWGRSR